MSRAGRAAPTFYDPMRSAAGVLALLAVLVSIALGAAAAGGGGVRTAKAAGPLHGVSGNASRFKAQTGQDSTVVQVFIGWGQGVTWGARLDVLIPTLTPIPMLHLGTKGKDGREAITPAGIATGRGDDYLLAIGQAIARFGRAIYVRPMAEMNNTGTPYSAYGPDGRARDAAHSAAEYRKAFARIYLILHGGPASVVDAKLRALGLPPVRGGGLPTNPFPRLRIVWSPLAGGTPRVAGNSPEAYYPGRSFVDVEGGDIYDDGLVDNAPWSELEGLYRDSIAHGKPFSVPEWGLFGVDDPAFVDHMCTFLKTHRTVEMHVFFTSSPASPLDLQSRPKSRAEYRRCITPMPEATPSWATGAPQVSSILLTLTASPGSGPSPLAVQFALAATLSVPIARWQLYFGDGGQVGGPGQPPGTVQHSYTADGVYDAVLVVYAAPPFTPAAASFLVAATVTAGNATAPVVTFQPTPPGGRAPVKVVFRTDLQPTATVSTWEIAFGDGTSVDGTGTPPRFVGHTYTNAGPFRAVLVVDESPSGRLVAYADVAVTGAPTGSTTTPPATATPVGVVLVGGVPFSGGTIPYGSRVDVTKGRLTLTTDTGKVTVYGGGVTAAFQLRRATLAGKPIVELRLVGGDFSECKKRKVSAAGATKPPKTVRRLWANGKGRFRTRGRYVSAAVLGTFWLTADRCDASLVTVRRGTVRVTDLPRRKTANVKAGKTYLARKP